MAGDRIVIDELRDLGALEALRHEWSALCDRAQNGAPFVRPEWLLPWCRHLGPKTFHALALREGARLVGLAPLFTYTKPCGERTVALLGAGESDSLGLVTESEAESRTARAVVSWLCDTRSAWDAIELDQLRQGSALLEVAMPAGLTSILRDQDVCPEASLVSLAPHPLARARKYRRRAEREHPVTLARSADVAWQELLSTLFTLHEARWRSRGGTGQLGSPEQRAFYSEAAAELAGSGALRMYALRFGDRHVAGLYAIREGDRLACYMQGIDPSHERHSPGVQLLALAFQDAASEGMRAIDFLRGREPYKYEWGAVDRSFFRRRITKCA